MVWNIVVIQNLPRMVTFVSAPNAKPLIMAKRAMEMECSVTGAISKAVIAKSRRILANQHTLNPSI